MGISMWKNGIEKQRTSRNDGMMEGLNREIEDSFTYETS